MRDHLAQVFETICRTGPGRDCILVPTSMTAVSRRPGDEKPRSRRAEA